MKILNGTSMLVNFAQNNHISILKEAQDSIPLHVVTIIYWSLIQFLFDYSDVVRGNLDQAQGSLRRRNSNPSVQRVFESHRVARTYDDIFDWLVSYAVCD